jgi:hypothetical protein
MSTPIITSVLGGYSLEWAPEQIKINVSRIRETRISTIAEILITCTSPGLASPHIKQTSFSLTANDARPKLAKELEKIYQTNWDVILEQLCIKVLAEIRRGEPVVILGQDGMKADPPEYLIDLYIIKNQPNVFFGEPGSAKTTWGLELASCVTTGWKDNPGKLVVANKKERCLWLDYETDQSVIAWQLASIKRGNNFEVPNQIFYRRCSSPLADDLEQIKQAIDDYKATCLFIDSLGLACGGDLNSAEPALRFFTALRQLKITSVILAHTARNTDSSNKHIYGSMFFEAQSRNVWELVKSNDDEDSIVIGLYHKKPPPFGKLHKPMGYKFTFDNDDNTTYFEYNDPKSVDELLERMGTNTKIIEALKSGPLTPRELEEKGIKNPRTPLARLKRKGIVTLIGKETYGLVDNEHAQD